MSLRPLYREVHLCVGGLLVFEHTVPLVDDLVEAMIVSWETDVEHLPGVTLGRYEEGVLSALVLAPVCTVCQLEPPTLFGVVDEDFFATCEGCAPPGAFSFEEVSVLLGFPFEFYSLELLPEARVRFEALWLARDLEDELRRNSSRASFLDLSERPRWLAEHGSSPSALLGLVESLAATGELLDHRDALRAALEPHRETFASFRVLPQASSGAPLGLLFTILDA